MQTVSTWFAVTSKQPGRLLTSRVYVMWDGATWTDESEYLEAHEGALRLGVPGDELVPPGDVGDATVLLHNPGRFNENGPLAPYIGGPAGLFGKQIKIKMGFKAFGGTTEERVCIFTGVIYDWTPGSKLTLRCRDMGYAYLQHKTSCAVRVNRRVDQLISDYADLAGIPAEKRVLDVSSFIIPWGWLDDESIIDEMWEVVRSEGGRVYFDQLGRLRYEAVQRWARHVIPDLVLGDDFTYCAWDEQSNPDALASSVTVEWAGRYVGAEMVLYTLEEIKVIRPGETLEFEARLSHPCVHYSALSSSDYKVVSVGGVDMAGSVTISLPQEQRYAQRCTVRLSNNHANLSASVVFLQIRGYPLLGGPTEQITVQAVNPPTSWRRNRNVRGNLYMQTWEQAVTQAQFLAGRYQRLARVATLTDLPGLPQLELGDRVRWLQIRSECELLANTSFESNTSGWAITSYGPFVTRTSGYGAIYGAYALLADFTPAGTNAYALVLSTAVPCTPGDIYNLTGWCKQIWSAFSAAQGVDVGLRFLDSGGNVVQDNLSAAAADKDNWVAFSAQCSAPAGATQVQAYLQPYADNGGSTEFKALLDGLSLRRSAYREGFVIGLSWRYAADHGYRQTLQLLDATQLYPHADYFVIGATALGVAGRAWY